MRTMVRARVDLPQPDSPTGHSLAAANIEIDVIDRVDEARRLENPRFGSANV